MHVLRGGGVSDKLINTKKIYIDMPKFANRLDELLADAVLASGITRQSALENIRQYIRTTPTDQLKKEIAQITSIPELQMLQAAGVPQPLLDTFLFVYQRLTQA